MHHKVSNYLKERNRGEKEVGVGWDTSKSTLVNLE